MSITVEKRKAMGVCIRCGEEIEEERKLKGYQKCGVCVKRETESRREANAYNKKLNRCIRCGKQKEPERCQLVYCAACSVVLADAGRRTRASHVRSGKCMNCGRLRIGEGCTSVLCPECADRRRIKIRAKAS